MFKVELEAGDLGEYWCYRVWGIPGTRVAASSCCLCLTPETGSVRHRYDLQTGECLLGAAQIVLDWEFVAWNTNHRIPIGAQCELHKTMLCRCY